MSGRSVCSNHWALLNSAENPGFIEGPTIGTKQKDWLVKTLTAIKKSRDAGPRKALLLATHHPPFSSGGHSGSAGMLKDVQDACDSSKIMPDAFFSGRAHSIQRYTRTLQFQGKRLKTPFIVSGCGGHGGQTISTNTGVTSGDHTYEFGYKGWGYTKAEITQHELKITSYGVDPKTGKKNVIDGVTVNLT